MSNELPYRTILKLLDQEKQLKGLIEVLQKQNLLKLNEITDRGEIRASYCKDYKFIRDYLQSYAFSGSSFTDLNYDHFMASFNMKAVLKDIDPQRVLNIMGELAFPSDLQNVVQKRITEAFLPETKTEWRASGPEDSKGWTIEDSSDKQLKEIFRRILRANKLGHGGRIKKLVKEASEIVDARKSTVRINWSGAVINDKEVEKEFKLAK